MTLQPIRFTSSRLNSCIQLEDKRRGKQVKTRLPCAIKRVTFTAEGIPFFLIGLI